MAKRASIEERLETLAALEGAAPTDELTTQLCKALAIKTGLVVEAAVAAVRTIDFDAAQSARLEEAMCHAFAQLSVDGVKRDPLCRGKLALATLTHERGRFIDDIIAAGARLIQREPVWGGAQDTAADLRARCGLAYSELYHPDAINVLAELLADKERNTRAGAAHALGNSGRPEAIPLLRYKALTGDVDDEVISSTYRALLALDPDESIDFISARLESDDESAEAAALCLGESRLAEALAPLRAWSREPEHREVGYLAIALLRLEAATDFLVDEIATGDEDAAAAAESALETLPMSEALVRRLEQARKKGDELRGS